MLSPLFDTKSGDSFSNLPPAAAYPAPPHHPYADDSARMIQGEGEAAAAGSSVERRRWIEAAGRKQRAGAARVWLGRTATCR